jgi:biopolymer transport protein ExbB/TolQ
MKTLTDLAKDQAGAPPLLSFDRMDVERRIGFPAGQFTAPGPLLALLGAAVLAVGFYGALSVIPDDAGYNDMFTQRGWVPYIIVFFATWSMMILLVKQGKLRLQRRALRVNVLPEDDPGFVLTPASAEDVLANLYRLVDDPQRFLLTKRIHHALANLRNIGRVGDVDEILRTQAENDEGIVDSSYTVVRGLIWAIPVLGFIGTVQGLSVALGSFWKVVANSDNVGQMREALQSVTGGLSTAFETTLVGLVAALGIHLLMILVRRREEQFLDQCKDYCQKYVVGRLRLADVAAAGEP